MPPELVPLAFAALLVWSLYKLTDWLCPLTILLGAALVEFARGALVALLRLCRRAARGVYRQYSATWRNSVRQRGIAMTLLLHLIALATVVTLIGAFRLSPLVLAVAVWLWLLVWPTWRLANWLAQRRLRARPLPARRWR